MSVICLTSTATVVLDRIITHLPQPPTQIRLGFIDTAAEVEQGAKEWLRSDREALVKVGFLLTDFTLSHKTPEEVRTFLGEVDGVFLSGGNSFYLLQQARKSGFDQLITHALKEEFIYIGSSAGSVVAGPDISMIAGLDDPSAAPELSSFEGLGLVDFTVLPHWGSPKFKAAYEASFEQLYQSSTKMVPLKDDQFVIESKTVESN